MTSNVDQRADIKLGHTLTSSEQGWLRAFHHFPTQYSTTPFLRMATDYHAESTGPPPLLPSFHLPSSCQRSVQISGSAGLDQLSLDLFLWWVNVMVTRPNRAPKARCSPIRILINRNSVVSCWVLDPTERHGPSTVPADPELHPEEPEDTGFAKLWRERGDAASGADGRSYFPYRLPVSACHHSHHHFRAGTGSV